MKYLSPHSSLTASRHFLLPNYCLTLILVLSTKKAHLVRILCSYTYPSAGLQLGSSSSLWRIKRNGDSRQLLRTFFSTSSSRSRKISETRRSISASAGEGRYLYELHRRNVTHQGTRGPADDLLPIRSQQGLNRKSIYSPFDLWICGMHCESVPDKDCA